MICHQMNGCTPVIQIVSVEMELGDMEYRQDRARGAVNKSDFKNATVTRAEMQKH